MMPGVSQRCSSLRVLRVLRPFHGLYGVVEVYPATLFEMPFRHFIG